MLDDISGSAKSLASALRKFGELADRLVEPSAPSRRPHIAYVDQLLEQAAAGLAANDVIDEDTVLALAYFRRRDFLQRLTAVEAIAREAKEQLDPSALKRSSGQMRDPALFNLVWRARKVWTSMTGRTPSAERTISKTRQTDDPDFVLLVQAIAGLADKILPSRKQIATALAMSPPA